MIIKKCHVDNFGKIKNFDFDFDKGLNVINEENSWGKTTFSNFIKAMFYGLEYNSKKTNERKQYEPWQGGAYGGYIVIEIDGKEYRIERAFGKKDKDDTFSLYDVETGKISSDFSENIGEEIFKIDRDSFVKSIYIPQCQPDTGMTDKLNAKIGNLTQAKDDISNYEIVMKTLEEKKKEYESRSRKSRISQTKKEITDLQAKLKEKTELLEATGLIEEHIKAKKQELSDAISEKEKCSEILVRQSKKTEDTALYNNALSNLKKSEEKIKEITEKYNGKVPNGNDLDLLKNESENIKNLETQIEFLGITEEVYSKYQSYKELFKEGVPDETVLNKLKGIIDQLKTLKLALENENNQFGDEEKYRELKGFFAEKNPTEEEIDGYINSYHKAEMLKKEILEDEIKLKAYGEKNEKSGKGMSIAMPLIGLAIIILGIIIFVATTNLLTLGISAVGIVILLYGILSGKKDSVNKELKEENVNLQAEIELKKQKVSELQNSYEEFVKCFRVRYSENIMNVLIEIKSKQAEFTRLAQYVSNHDNNVERYEKEIKECNNFIWSKLSPFMSEDSMTQNREALDYEKAYEELKERVNSYYSLNEKIEKYKILSDRLKVRSSSFNEIKEQYIKNGEFDIDAFENDYREYVRESSAANEMSIQIEKLKRTININDDDEVLSVMDLNEKIAQADENIRKISEDINIHQRNAEINYITLEELDGIEDEIEQKKKLLEEYKEKYDILDMTLSYMQLAKEKFSSRYLGPMRDAFSHYLKMINGIEGANISAKDLDIDIDLCATLNYGSVSRSKDSLSKGYQDLVGLCIRFALVDVMYNNESPVLILDDPFVNLDEKKIQNALKMVSEMSNKYQVIYFTCHKSRAH